MQEVIYADIKYKVEGSNGYACLVPYDSRLQVIQTDIAIEAVTLNSILKFLLSAQSINTKACPHPIDSFSLARVETKTNCKGKPFEKKIYYCEQCGAEFSL
jgi:hypothetical protein